MKIRLLVIGAALGAAFLLVAPHEGNYSGQIAATLNQIPGVHATVDGK